MACAPVRSIIPSLKLGDYRLCRRTNSEGIINRTGAQTMLYHTCTMISSVDLAHYGLSRPKDWVSGDCVTIKYMVFFYIKLDHQRWLLVHE